MSHCVVGLDCNLMHLLWLCPLTELAPTGATLGNNPLYYWCHHHTITYNKFTSICGQSKMSYFHVLDQRVLKSHTPHPIPKDEVFLARVPHYLSAISEPLWKYIGHLCHYTFIICNINNFFGKPSTKVTRNNMYLYPLFTNLLWFI